jgi:hypothetical protein
MNWNEVTFGVEIECFVRDPQLVLAAVQAQGIAALICNNDHRTNTKWKLVHDASIRPTPGHRALELISPILKGQAGLEAVIKVCAALAQVDAKINQSCGLHVHCGANNASVTQLKNLAKLFCLYELQFDELVPVSRRANNAFIYAKSNLQFVGGIDEAFRKLDRAHAVRTVATVMNGGYDTSTHYTQLRYYKLNMQSLASHGTVEFRQHSGSVDGAKITAWVRLVTGFVASAFSVSEVKRNGDRNFDQLMRKVDKTTEQYLRTRRTALARVSP